MSTVADAHGQVVLENTSWATYERLLAEHAGQCGTRFAYCDGELETIVVSAGHEDVNQILSLFVNLVAGELDVDYVPRGATTFKREDLGKGFEPDSCFYFRNADAVRGKPQIDLNLDPPPELVIEIDVTRRSLNKFPIYHALGVEEVWRYVDGEVKMYKRSGRNYAPIRQSGCLPILTPENATHWVAESRREKIPAWQRKVRAWVRAR